MNNYYNNHKYQNSYFLIEPIVESLIWKTILITAFKTLTTLIDKIFKNREFANGKT